MISLTNNHPRIPVDSKQSQARGSEWEIKQFGDETLPGLVKLT